jgi:Skp family chaperone for outer membrane proteins
MEPDMQIKSLCVAGALFLTFFLTGCDESRSLPKPGGTETRQPAATSPPVNSPAGEASNPAMEASRPAPSGARVAIINTGTIFKESDAGKAGAAHLDALAKELQTELTKLQGEAQDGKNKEAVEKLQTRLAQMQRRFDAEQQMVLNTINEASQKAVDTCREAEKIDLVINEDSVLSFSPQIDISHKVIEQMNRTPVVYNPLPAENGIGNVVAPGIKPGAADSANATGSANAAGTANSTVPGKRESLK